MARIRFTANFRYRPLPSITYAYRAGTTETVKRDCADQAIAAGKAIDLAPRKVVSDGETADGG